MMMEMLQEKIYSEVQFDASAFEKYISENTLSQRDNYGKDCFRVHDRLQLLHQRFRHDPPLHSQRYVHRQAPSRSV